MSGTLILVLLSLVTFVTGQSQVPPLKLKIARNNLSPNDSVLISWEIPSADVESFSVEWEAVVSGQGGEIPVALVPNKTDRYSVVLKPMTIGLEYNVEVTALLPPPLRLSEFKTFTFAPMALVDVAIFGITQRSMALNVTALEPLSAKDNIKVTINSDGALVPISNISVIGHVGRSRFLNVYLPNDIIVVPAKTYQVKAESMFLDSPSSSVSEWITPTSVPAAPISAIVKTITPYAMELDVRLANQIDYNLNFSFVVDVFDMNGKLYSVRNGVIRNTGGENNTARLYFDEQLPSGMDYFIRLKTEYNGIESYWFSDLQTVNLHPEATDIQEVVRDTPTSFNVTLVFGSKSTPLYRLYWTTQDGQYAGNATFSNRRNLNALQVTVSGLVPGQTYDVSIEALGNEATRAGLEHSITLAPSSPIFKGVERNDLDPSRSAILKWESGEGRSNSFVVTMDGGVREEVTVQPGEESTRMEYSTIVPTPVVGTNYFGNLTAIVDGIESDPTQIGFTFAPNAPTSVTLGALTPLQAALNISQFEDVPPTPLAFLLQDELGTFYPPQNGTFLSTESRHRQVRMFFNPPLPANRRYIIGVQSEYNGNLSLPVFTSEPFALDPLTPTLIDAQPVGDDKAFLLWLPGERIPRDYLVEWYSLDSPETGSLVYLTPATYVDGPLNVTVTNLTASQRYKFSVRALGSPLTASSLNSTVAIPPAQPRLARIYPTPTSPSDSLTLSWQAGRGTIDFYNITMAGSDGFFLQRTIPASDSLSGEYSIIASPVTPGATYLASIFSEAGNTISEPVNLQFVNVPSSPSSVTVTGIAPYSVDLTMNVLDEEATVDSVNVVVSDEEGVSYPPQNVTVTPGEGTRRLIRLIYDQSQPLPLDREYTVTVQTVSNGTLSGPINTGDPRVIDPLTPSLIGMVSEETFDPETGDATTVIGLAPGQGDITAYLVEWFSTDGSDVGNFTYTLQPGERQNLVMIPITSLIPGQIYTVRITGVGANRTAQPVESYIPMRPLPPRDVTVRRDLASPGRNLLLEWSSSGGRVDFYVVEILGSDGSESSQIYRPSSSGPALGPFTLPLTDTTSGLNYNVAITSGVDGGLTSNPTFLSFTQASAAPTDVRLTKITRSSGELEVSLLDETAENPVVEVELVDDDGRVYRANENVEWEGSGQTRLLRVYFPDRPLPPNQNYTVRVRTLSNGNWTSPATATEQTYLDPLTPSIVRIRDQPDGENSTATLTLLQNPGAEEYRVEWFSTDASEFGGLNYSPTTAAATQATLDIPVQGLTPGQSYVFRVTTTSDNRTHVGLDYPITLSPTQPEFLYVDRDLTSPDESLFFRWSSGGGKSDRYDVSIIGSDGLNINREYIPGPSEQEPYTIPLPPLTPEAKYGFSVQAFANDIQSIPAFRGFRYVDTDPTKVELLQMTPYTVELGVTLLGNTTETPELEASLRDGQDRNLFVVSNATTWRGTGRDRVVRVDMSDQPLRADRDYKVSVRTLHQGEWSSSLTTDNFITLNPLTPTVTSIQLAPDPDSLSTGASMSALVGVQPGESPVGSYLVEWTAVDGSERGNTTYIPTPEEIFLPVSIPVTGLTPGEQYSFRVTASQGDRNATGLDYRYTQDPAMPQSLLIEMDPTSPDGLILYWTPGTGKADFFNINVVGNDGQRTNRLYTPTPSDTPPYSFTLPTLTRGGTYAFSVQAVADNIQSVPALKGFRFVDTDPTEVELLQMTPYTVELGVTLLGNTTETPELEASLRDGQGRDLFVVSNATTWRGSGRDRVVRVDMSGRPLKADRDYRVAVRTKHNGAFGEVMLADNTLTLDPLTPSVTSIRLAADPDSQITGVSTSALVGVQPGESPVGSYLVEWTAVDGSERGNTTYIPTPEEIFLPVSIPVTGLTPGEQYSFRVTASQGDRNATGLDYRYTQVPARPSYLKVEPSPNSDDLLLSWRSGGGKTDVYSIRVDGSDGLRIEQDYVPLPDHSPTEPYTVRLPPTIPGADYRVSMEAVVDDVVTSLPASLTFTSVATAPTEVSLKQITQYGGELEVTLLGDNTETPELEVIVSDSEGRPYVSSNDTVWEGTGRQRLVRVQFPDTPLPANQSYSVSVRTAYNGTWTMPVTSQDPVALDPLAPSIVERQTGGSTPGPTPVSYTLVWMPGPQLADEYLIEWMTEDGSETGNMTYVPTTVAPDGSLSQRFDELTPGQRYKFKVTAITADQRAPGITNTVEQRPATPTSLTVDPHPNPDNSSLVLSWKSGGGRTDFYRTLVEGTDGSRLEQNFVPLASLHQDIPYRMVLPPTRPGENYRVSVEAVVDNDLTSDPALLTFTSLATAPTEVNVKQITQYGGELEVKMLGNSNETPDLEVTVRNNEGTELVTSNDTVWEGTGRRRLVRVQFPDTPLPANQSYSVSVRTAYNGTWTMPVTSQDPVVLDPLAPSIMEREPDRSKAATGSYTLVWMPGPQVADQYLIEWMTEDGPETGNLMYTPTGVGADGSLSVRLDNLTPGQRYQFKVTAVTADQTSPGMASMVSLDPPTPDSLAVEPSDTGDILFTWYPGDSGRVTGYDVRLTGAGVETFNTVVVPDSPDVKENTKFTVRLPPLVEGTDYTVGVAAVVNDVVRSPESSLFFTYSKATPSRAGVRKVYQDGFEMNVTLLGDNPEAPLVQAELTDEDGRVYPVINGTVVQKARTFQIVRFPYNESSLPENRTYSASIRTFSDGVWSSPITTTVPLIVDPLAPSLLGFDVTQEVNGTRTVQIRWEGGTTVPDTLTVNWVASTPEGSGSRTETVTSAEERGVTTVTNLTPGATYTFLVTAQKADLLSTSSNLTLSMRPSPIRSVQIEPSQTSPDDTVTMTWEKGDGVVDFHRISMKGPEGVVFHADVPVDESAVANSHNVSLSPVAVGTRYLVTIWSVVNKDVLSSATDVSFMFAPTAPTSINLREVGGNSAEVEVDMFDTIRSDVTQSLNVSLVDDEGRTYAPDRTLEWRRDGRRSHLRLWFDQDLPANQTYTATAVSQVNGTWTEPVFTKTPVTLDTLKPSITDVMRGGDQSAVVEWRSGSQPADAYFVERQASRSGLTDTQNVPARRVPPGQTVRTEFSNLSPGQEYLFTVRAVQGSQISDSFPYPFTLDPVPPSNLLVGYSEVSPSDSAMIMWDFDNGEMDFFRVTWSPVSDGMDVSTVDVSPNATVMDGRTTYAHRLSPLVPGQTYRVLLQTVSSARPGEVVEKIFTFAPTSPSHVTITGVSPYMIGLNMSLFEASWENLTVRTEIRDEANLTYVTDSDVVWETDGRDGSARLAVSQTRLPADKNYTLTVQTQYNGEWSHPVVSSLYLDPLTPAIRSIQKSPDSPDTELTVMWLPGSVDTNVFFLTLTSLDGSERQMFEIPALIADLDTPQVYTVGNLTAGQQYMVQLSALLGDRQAASLPYVVVMDPSAPRDVAVDRYETSPNDSAVVRWGKGEGTQDSFNLTWSQYDPVTETVYPDTVRQDVIPADGLALGDYQRVLSPLTQGNTYQVMAQAISADTPGQAVGNIFTFAPTAPTGVTVTGVTPYSVGMNVSLFGDTWENVTLQAEILDSDNKTYPAETMLSSAEGRHGISTLMINETRLPADRNYTVKVQTMYDGVWSYPFMRTVTLDPLTPAILSVREDPDSPATALTVVWVPGQIHSNQFTLELVSVDGSERRPERLYTDIRDPDTPQQFTFTGLTPGQSYRVQLASVTTDKTAPALDYTIQLPPSSPSDVVISRNDQSPADSALVRWTLREGDQDGFRVTLSEYGPGGAVLQATEVTPTPQLSENGVTFEHTLSPLISGQTYNLTLETVSGGRTGYPVTTLFTFAPSAPSAVTVEGAGPYGVDVSMSVFGDSVRDVPVRVEVRDTQNVTYPASDVQVVRSEGNTGVVRVSYNDTQGRLSPTENYTVSIQTRIDNTTWSYPIMSEVSVDPLTPAIVEVERDLEYPETSVHVSFVPGSNQTRDFFVTLISLDKTERREIPVNADTGDVNTPVSVKFEGLTPGQQYHAQVTALGENSTASSLTWDIQTHGVAPSNVRITPSVDSPADSVVLRWDYLTDKDSSFVISWSELWPTDFTEVDFDVRRALRPALEEQSFTISPLTPTKVYQVRIQTRVGDLLGYPDRTVFTFAPTAPSEFKILGLTPNGAVMNVSLFDERAWENVTLRVQVNDTYTGLWYPTGEPVVEEPTGRHALVRVALTENRLPPGEEYLVTVQTLYNNTWSWPMRNIALLGSLVPAITDVRPHSVSPDTGFTVFWLPGQNGTQTFSLELESTDGSEYYNETVTGEITDINRELNYSFSDLRPGQRYIFKLTAIGHNKTASALNRTIQMYPALPSDVRLDRSELSPDNSAALLWEYGDGLHDAFRVTWSPLDQSSDPVSEDVLPNTTRDRSVTAHSYELSPLAIGQTYHVMLEPLAGSQSGMPVEKIFTFAPGSPTQLNLRGVTPFSVGMDVSLFGEAWDNITLQAQVNDTEGNTYRPDNVTVVRTDGRHGVTRILFENDRLPAGRNYTVSLLTLYNDTWSYPITSTISLDALTPAVVDVEPAKDSPSTAFMVTWVAGSNDTDMFLLRVFAVDGSEEKQVEVTPSTQSTDTLLNYTFTGLTPGQKYVVQLTAIMGEKNASALNATVQMYPPVPTGVRVLPSRQRTDELAFTWTAHGVVDHFVVEGESVNDQRVRFEQVIRGLESVNGTYNYVVWSLERGDTYRIRVKAVDGNLVSASPYTNVTLFPGKPYDVQLSKYDLSPDDTLLLSWKPRGGRVDYFLIEVSQSRGRGFLYDLKAEPQGSEPYKTPLGALVKGERYEVSVRAVVGGVSSEPTTVSSTVGPSVNIRGMTPVSLDVDLDLFGNVYNDMNVTVNVTDQSGRQYPVMDQANLTEYADQGRQLIRLNFQQPLPLNNNYSVSAELSSQGVAVLRLDSEPTLLDGITPYILSLNRHAVTPNTSLTVHWLPGQGPTNDFTVRWSQVTSPDVEERVVKPIPGPMEANLTELSPGDMYSVLVIATGLNGRHVSSVPEFRRLVPALPVDVTAIRNEVDPQITVRWSRGSGSVECFNTTIWPRPAVPGFPDPTCLPAKAKGENHEISYTGLLPGETYWTGIHSEQSGLQSDKVWVPVTMYPPKMRVLSVKEDPELGVVVLWEPLEEGKVDNVELSWASLQGGHNGSLVYRPSEQTATVDRLLPGTSYIIGVNSQVLDNYGQVVTTKGDTLLFVTEPVAPQSATFETTKDGVMVNVEPGQGLADSYLFQWQSDEQRPGQARFSADQAEGQNSSIELPPGARYVFTVKSISGGKESPAMVETVITDPDPPSNLVASLGQEPSSSVGLTWDHPRSNSQGYRVSWDPSSKDGSSELIIDSGRKDSLTVSNLKAGTTYNFSVQTLSWGSLSEPVNASIHLAPSVPSVVYAEPTANSTIAVGWTFGQGAADTAFIYVDDGFTARQVVVGDIRPSEDSHRVYHYEVKRLKEQLKYDISMATGSQGVQGSRSIPIPVTIPLASEAPRVGVNVTSRSAALTWQLPTADMPPAPVPVKDKYRIRVISPDVTNMSACVKEIVVGFCRDCGMGSSSPGSEPQPDLSNNASPCLEKVHEMLPVSDTVSYNVSGLLPYSDYKILWYPEGERSAPGTVVTAQTSIEAPEWVSAPVVRMLKDLVMEVCALPPEPYPGPTTYRLEVFDNQPGSSLESLLNVTFSDVNAVSDNLTHCINITGQPFWSYRFSLVASTEVGSIRSNDTIFDTPESTPGPVSNLEVQSIPSNFSAVRLVWDYPVADQSVANITGYVIRYWRAAPEHNDDNNSSSDNSSSGLYTETIIRDLSGIRVVDGHLVTDLPIKPEYNYSVQVGALTETGLFGNVSQNITFASQIGPPPPLSSDYPPVVTLVTEQEDPNKITVSVNPAFFMDNSHGDIVDYGLVVMNSELTSGPVVNGKGPEYYSNYMNWNNARKGQEAAYRATPLDWTLDPTMNQAVFTIGGDQQCVGLETQFCNGELVPSKQYSVKGFSCTQAGCTETQFYSGFTVGPQDGGCGVTADRLLSQYTDLELALIIVVVILLLLIIILVVLVLILFLRRQKQKEGRLLKGELNDGHDTMVRGQHMGLTKM